MHQCGSTRVRVPASVLGLGQVKGSEGGSCILSSSNTAVIDHREPSPLRALLLLRSAQSAKTKTPHQARDQIAGSHGSSPDGPLRAHRSVGQLGYDSVRSQRREVWLCGGGGAAWRCSRLDQRGNHCAAVTTSRLRPDANVSGQPPGVPGGRPGQVGRRHRRVPALHRATGEELGDSIGGSTAVIAR